jgi:hypothetical protein
MDCSKGLCKGFSNLLFTVFDGKFRVLKSIKKGLPTKFGIIITVYMYTRSGAAKS